MKRVGFSVILVWFLAVGLSANAVSLKPDYDGDGMPDQQEVVEGLDPLLRDHDIFTSNRWFVQQAWRDLFIREIDTSALTTWTAQMDNGLTRKALLRTLVQSDDFARSVAPAGRVRWAAGEELDASPTHARLRADIVEYQQTLSWKPLAKRLSDSPAFAARFPQTSALEFVRAIHARANLTLSVMEETELASRLDAGTLTRDDIVLIIANDSRFVRATEGRVWGVVLDTLLRQCGPTEGLPADGLIHLDALARLDAFLFLIEVIQPGTQTHPESYNVGMENIANIMLTRGEYVTRFMVFPADSDRDQVPDIVEQYWKKNVLVKDNDIFGPLGRFDDQQARDFLFREPDQAMELLSQQYLNSIGPVVPNEVRIAHLLHYSRVQNTIGKLWLMYRAAFERSPRFSDFSYGGARMRSNSPLHRLAAELVSTAQFEARYPQVDNSAFIEALYRGILQRPPRSDELLRWTRELNAGTSRGNLLLELSQSQEYRTPDRLAQRSWELLHLAMQRSNVPTHTAAERQQLSALVAAHATGNLTQILDLEAQRARQHLDSGSYRARFLP